MSFRHKLVTTFSSTSLRFNCKKFSVKGQEKPKVEKELLEGEVPQSLTLPIHINIIEKRIFSGVQKQPESIVSGTFKTAFDLKKKKFPEVETDMVEGTFVDKIKLAIIMIYDYNS